MLIPEDEKFERYLKQFRPVQPDAIPEPEVVIMKLPSRSRALWAAVAAVLIVGGGVLGLHRSSTTPKYDRPIEASRTDAPPVPLTIRSANAWLAQAPSIKTGINTLAFSSQGKQVQQGEQSAIAVLSKEKIKL